MYAVSLKSLKNDKNMNLTFNKFGTGHQNHFTCFIYLFFKLSRENIACVTSIRAQAVLDFD